MTALVPRSLQLTDAQAMRLEALQTAVWASAVPRLLTVLVLCLAMLMLHWLTLFLWGRVGFLKSRCVDSCLQSSAGLQRLQQARPAAWSASQGRSRWLPQPRCAMRHATRRPLPADLVFPKLEIAFLDSSMVAVAQSMGMLLAGACAS